jgi:hypothetical protein
MGIIWIYQSLIYSKQNEYQFLYNFLIINLLNNSNSSGTYHVYAIIVKFFRMVNIEPLVKKYLLCLL